MVLSTKTCVVQRRFYEVLLKGLFVHKRAVNNTPGIANSLQKHGKCFRVIAVGQRDEVVACSIV